jgi:hypothetical protein
MKPGFNSHKMGLQINYANLNISEKPITKVVSQLYLQIKDGA